MIENECLYEGVFVRPEAVTSGLRDRRPLENAVRFTHVTVLYKPSSTHEALYGERVRITVTGYASDGDNEGVRVTMHTGDPALRQLLDAVPVPHITLSVSRGGAAVNTARLAFQPTEAYTVEGVFGMMKNDHKTLIK